MVGPPQGAKPLKDLFSHPLLSQGKGYEKNVECYKLLYIHVWKTYMIRCFYFQLSV